MTNKTKNAAMYILLSIGSAVLYIVAHACATESRGYEAIGGEAFIFLLPVLYYVVRSYVTDAGKAVKIEKHTKPARKSEKLYDIRKGTD